MTTCNVLDSTSMWQMVYQTNTAVNSIAALSLIKATDVTFLTGRQSRGNAFKTRATWG